jgi:hypothetical protein
MELDPQTEQTLADMSDEDWSALTARVRPPTSRNQLRDIASKHVPGDQLESFLAIASPKAFANEIGDIDESKVQHHANRLFGPNEPQQQHQWGQHSSGGAPGKQRGDDVRAALEKRHGVRNPSPIPVVKPGDMARAAIEKRHHVKRQHP